MDPPPKIMKLMKFYHKMNKERYKNQGKNIHPWVRGSIFNLNFPKIVVNGGVFLVVETSLKNPKPLIHSWKLQSWDTQIF